MASFDHYRVSTTSQYAVMEDTEDDIPGKFLEDLERKLKIDIIRLDDNDIEFDLIGIDASVANALRRIMLAEVPTLAIEQVWIAINTSIIQDEILSHRMGLIPIAADPNQFEYVVDEEETDADTVVFHLEFQCPELPNNTERDENGLPTFNKAISDTQCVMSNELIWLPQGNQAEKFPDGIKPVHPDIVIAKLSPGQKIEFEAHCRKGLGKDHTKFSPVATASYRLLPDVRFLEPVTGDLALELQAMCPMDVFDIEDMGKKGGGTAVAARPRDCTMCRECIRKEGWSDRIQLNRKSDHFIFTVESTGCIPPEVIVREALGVLKQKAVTFHGHAEDFERTEGDL
mmetsp:Transcript_16612/g.15964  ORF Transcript_16612/g.15964 Transcript_16612/m.15964 type:complete len:343 (+) Transcript_16612:133-1161(+)|eukprot:CAMPEP_0119046398 /NCGR_PEP_ID=MMETSP1177-20130426/46375_1 /TAXON_ID=2985 /ORGANISM="Ochromonas sp, Strain CCMP1899" /LENGTH=342 /DNA_ID=CAMNT_0007019495 /DNA_START=51 /DNA_END=1079 /DNA_ORIENTATION=+